MRIICYLYLRNVNYPYLIRVMMLLLAVVLGTVVPPCSSSEDKIGNHITNSFSHSYPRLILLPVTKPMLPEGRLSQNPIISGPTIVSIRNYNTNYMEYPVNKDTVGVRKHPPEPVYKQTISNSEKGGTFHDYRIISEFGGTPQEMSNSNHQQDDEAGGPLSSSYPPSRNTNTNVSFLEKSGSFHDRDGDLSTHSTRHQTKPETTRPIYHNVMGNVYPTHLPVFLRPTSNPALVFRSPYRSRVGSSGTSDSKSNTHISEPHPRPSPEHPVARAPPREASPFASNVVYPPKPTKNRVTTDFKNGRPPAQASAVPLIPSGGSLPPPTRRPAGIMNMISQMMAEDIPTDIRVSSG